MFRIRSLGERLKRAQRLHPSIGPDACLPCSELFPLRGVKNAVNLAHASAGVLTRLLVSAVKGLRGSVSGATIFMVLIGSSTGLRQKCITTSGVDSYFRTRGADLRLLTLSRMVLLR